jgi:hypothetical protein
MLMAQKFEVMSDEIKVNRERNNNSNNKFVTYLKFKGVNKYLWLK